MPKPYDKTTHDGKTVDWLTHAALLEAEIRLGYRLTLVQGSYNGTAVAASAGTHAGGGVIDLAPWDHVKKVRVLRDLGFAVWWRTPIPGVWGEHCHAVQIGNTKLAPAAARQVTAYRNRRDGLAGNRSDNTYHPTPIPTYTWPGSDAALALEKKAAALLDKPKTPAKPVPTVTALRVDGIDLSHHNTVTQVGLNSAANLGAKFVYLKATEGATVKDAAYASRRGMVRKAGMVVGAYHFARPDKDGKDGATEARFFLANAKPVPGDMRPVLDLEDIGHLSKTALTAWVAAWVATVKAATGSLPIIYTPFELADNFGCMLWVARYSDANAEPVVPKPWTRWRIRQFSDGKFGKPNAIAGMKVDLDTLHDGESLDWLRLPVVPTPEPAPVPVPKPVPTPAVPTSVTITVTGANIRSNPKMQQASIDSDIKTLAALPSTGARVFLGAEIAYRNYTDSWTTLLPGAAFCIEQECPVTLSRADWKIVGSQVVKTHGGLIHVTPARYISVVKAESVQIPGLLVAFVASHYISGAWSNNYPATKKWRQGKWAIHYAAEKALVAQLVADGYSVVGYEDANRSAVDPFHVAQVPLLDHGIDHVWAIPAHGRKVTKVSAGVTKGLKTDHEPITATLTIT